MADDNYYASVFGGMVCRTCGSVVMGIDEHDAFHEKLWLLAQRATPWAVVGNI